jgi:hypothetical protein
MEQTFSQFGTVGSAKVMMERDTGRSKGFGFVEMGSDAEAQAAIQGMHGQNFGGRDLVVNEARPMEPRVLRAAVASAAATVVAATAAVVQRWRRLRRRWWIGYGGPRRLPRTRMQGRRCLPSQSKEPCRAPFLLSETLPPHLLFPGTWLCGLPAVAISGA